MSRLDVSRLEPSLPFLGGGGGLSGREGPVEDGPSGVTPRFGTEEPGSKEDRATGSHLAEVDTGYEVDRKDVEPSRQETHSLRT